MRSRTLKEGSLGLFIFAGLSLLGVVLLWLAGSTLGKKTYTIHVLFEDANGMREGAVVRYRGIEVGRIIGVAPSTNGVDTTIEIQSVDLVLPKDVLIEANQGGLVGETSIDIIPNAELNEAAIAQSPISSDCSEQGFIICDEDRLQGVLGVSLEDTLRSTQQFSALYGDPEFVEKITKLTVNSGAAAEQIATLTKELTLLSQEVRGEVGNFSENAQSITDAAIASSNQFSQTMANTDRLTTNLNSLVVENRQTLVSTLNSISQTSDRMQQVVASLDTTLAQVNRGLAATDTELLMANLAALTANAATTSANLRDLSSTLNDPANIVMLQKTLDAARVTFENTQKITSDLDELSGDPAFRRNLIDLVNGLSQLVSSTEQLQEQVQVAGKLEPLQDEWSRLDLSVRPAAEKSRPRSFE